MPRDNPAIAIAALERQDVPAALTIQAEAYPAFLVEDEAAFASRIEISASYCLAAKQGSELLGYLLAHGWSRESPPTVGTVLADDVPSEVLYIHDLAISSFQRGRGVGHKLLDRAFELAARDGLRSAELIAVEGAANYWRGMGFTEGPVSDALRNKLATYGSRARWMTRAIPPGR